MRIIGGAAMMKVTWEMKSGVLPAQKWRICTMKARTRRMLSGWTRHGRAAYQMPF